MCVCVREGGRVCERERECGVWCVRERECVCGEECVVCV